MKWLVIRKKWSHVGIVFSLLVDQGCSSETTWRRFFIFFVGSENDPICERRPKTAFAHSNHTFRRWFSILPIYRKFESIDIVDSPKFLILRSFRFISLLGNSASYIAGTFTFSFITCGFGPEWIGLIMIAFGVTGTITSLSLGYLKSKIDRIFIFVFGFVCQLGLLLAILGKYIYPHPEHIEWLFIMAGRDLLTER